MTAETQSLMTTAIASMLSVVNQKINAATVTAGDLNELAQALKMISGDLSALDNLTAIAEQINNLKTQSISEINGLVAQAINAKNAAEAAREQAVSIVFEGQASATPAAGKIPIADVNGFVTNWVDWSLLASEFNKITTSLNS